MWSIKESPFLLRQFHTKWESRCRHLKKQVFSFFLLKKAIPVFFRFSQPFRGNRELRLQKKSTWCNLPITITYIVLTTYTFTFIKISISNAYTKSVYANGMQTINCTMHTYFKHWRPISFPFIIFFSRFPLRNSSSAVFLSCSQYSEETADFKPIIKAEIILN